jgi:hypothetical protein
MTAGRSVLQMARTEEQIENRVRERIRGFTDEELDNADPDAVIGVAFYPPFSADELRIADACWNRIIGERLRARRPASD